MEKMVEKYIRMVMKNLSDPSKPEKEVEFEMGREEARESLDEYSRIIKKPYTEPGETEKINVFSEETGDDGTIFVDAPLHFGGSQSELCVMLRIERNNGVTRAIIENITTP